MLAISIQSGSNGNAYYVEGGGVRVLVDAGISGKAIADGLGAMGRDIRRVDALLLSHDHGDHTRGAGVLHRRHQLPLYASAGTFATAKMGKLSPMGVRTFVPGQTIDLGGMRVQTRATPHDGAEGAVFIIEAESKRLGILTDLGHTFDGLADVVGELDAVFLESNYDPHMLRHGPYPAFLKRRIAGPGGHISNEESAELVAASATGQAWVCLAHLSEKNNTPRLAMETHQRRARLGDRLKLAGRYAPAGPFTL